MAAHSASNEKREAFGLAMTPTRKAVDGELAGVDDGPSVNGIEFKRDRAPCPSPHSPASIRTTTSRVPRTAVDRHRVGALPQPQRREETAECRARGRNGHGSTGSDRGVGSRRRRRSNWRCVPSPQSTRMRSLPASTRRPGWLRSAEGTLARSPKNVSANILAAWRLSYLISTDGRRSYTHFPPTGGALAVQADFRCGLVAGFFAAASFAGFLPAIGINISF